MATSSLGYRLSATTGLHRGDLRLSSLVLGLGLIHRGLAHELLREQLSVALVAHASVRQVRLGLGDLRLAGHDPLVGSTRIDARQHLPGLRERAGFVDGSATLTRPLWRQFSAGVGMWGGAQPGLARFDVGPRLSYRIGSKMRVHVDYRQRLLGQAAPGSGPVLTLAANF